MPSPLRILSAAFLAVSIFAPSPDQGEARADVPDWVPEQYAKFFYRRVDTRPAWKRALNFINPSVGETGPSFALVAGVSKYPNMSGRASDLWPARLDVEKMAAYLARPPESFNEIIVLLDDDMTPEHLRYFLTQYFPRRLSENPRSRFLFAYSGHGMTDDNGRGYILTSQATSLTDWFDGISLAELRAEFQAVVDRGHQVLALINSCYGVEFHRMSFAFGGAEDVPLPTREGAHAITAGGSGELTWHDDSFGVGDGPKGSIFFEAVFAALDGRADKLPTDGIVTVGELETYLHNAVSRFTEEKQNPTASDLISTTSPGGFFFLDRNRQIERGNAEPLRGKWWGEQAFGAAGPGWIGVKIQEVTEDMTEGLKLERAAGALIAGLSENGPAAKAGLQPGDVVVEFNGKPVPRVRDLALLVSETSNGDMVDLVIVREGERVNLQMEVGSRDDNEENLGPPAGDASSPSPERPPSEGSGPTVAPEEIGGPFGLSLAHLSPELRSRYGIAERITDGAVVVGVAEGSPADEKGLQSGDVIVGEGREPVLNPGELMSMVDDLKRAERRFAVLLVANKDGSERFVPFKLED